MRSGLKRLMARSLPALTAIWLIACQSSANENRQAALSTAASPAVSPEKSEAKGHEHSAPHGGALIEIGEEFAHLEVVFDSATGKLTAYALDGEAENAVRIKQPAIEITIVNPAGVIKLNGVANSLTGETAGETSEFAGQSDALKGASNFEGVIRSITIKGQLFKGVPFNFPEGNETK